MPERERNKELLRDYESVWKGYSYRSDQSLYVAEIRPPDWRKYKIGLGSYATQIAAAMAFDIGIYYTDKHVPFNILSHAMLSRRLPSLRSELSFVNKADIDAIRKFVRQQAKEFVEKNECLVPPLPSGLSFEISADAPDIRTFVRREVETAFTVAGSSSSEDHHAWSPYMASVAEDELLNNPDDQMFWERLLMPAPLDPVKVENKEPQDLTAQLADLPPEKLPPASVDQVVNALPHPVDMPVFDKIANEETQDADFV